MPTCDFPEGSICHKRKTPGWSRAEQGGLDQLCFGVPSDGPASRTQGRACTEPPHRDGLEYASAAGVGVAEGEATGKGRCPRRLSRGWRRRDVAGGGAGVTAPCSRGATRDARCGATPGKQTDVPGTGQTRAGCGTWAREERGTGPRGPESWAAEAAHGWQGGRARNTGGRGKWGVGTPGLVPRGNTMALASLELLI